MKASHYRSQPVPRKTCHITIDQVPYTYTVPVILNKSQTLSPDDFLLLNLEEMITRPGYRERILYVLKNQTRGEDHITVL